MDINEDILIRYIKGECSADEQAQVVHQLRHNNELFQRYLQLKDAWDYTGLKTNAYNYNEELEWERVEERLSLSFVRQHRLKRILNLAVVAAAVLFAFFIGHQFSARPDTDLSNGGAHVFTASEGQITQLTLADGSLVTLNAGSSLTVPSDFGHGSRDVQLVGEAHFNVTKHPKLVFEVHSGQQQVKVLGTIFNIRAYPDETQIVTTLEEGIVQWQSNGKHITMKPDMQVVFDVSTKNVEKRTVNSKRINQWSVGRYVFEDVVFGEVVDIIERWYNVRVDWQAEDFEGQHFHGVIKKSSSLSETLELLKVMTPISYSINGQEVIIKRMR
ncbi:FecR family protein [Carboxylicivirga taeanensis]|uniref:FecR family protein n=1 Tax=Carboxylicivirga taeanensis TaxID=1416875 RepID=UPI003F6DE56A